jgi:hypothetical protein
MKMSKEDFEAKFMVKTEEIEQDALKSLKIVTWLTDKLRSGIDVVGLSPVMFMTIFNAIRSERSSIMAISAFPWNLESPSAFLTELQSSIKEKLDKIESNNLK